MKINRKRRSKESGYKKIIYICIAAVLLLVPTGYGYWTDKLQVVSNITTGYCDLAFTDAKIVKPVKNGDVKIQKQNEHDKHGHGDKHETGIGNRLHIHIKDGETNKITFTITNYGTAPAIFNTEMKANQPFTIKFTNFKPKVDGDDDSMVIIGPNSSKTGDIIVDYKAVKDKNYNILIDLKSSGWNNYEFEVNKEAIKEANKEVGNEEEINEEIINEKEVDTEVIEESEVINLK